MKKELEITGRKVTIDIDRLSKGLCDLHDGDKATMLAFGMLDYGLCEMHRTMLTERVEKEFGLHICATFSGRVLDFIKDCTNEIEKGVYSYAKMVV